MCVYIYVYRCCINSGCRFIQLHIYVYVYGDIYLYTHLVWRRNTTVGIWRSLHRLGIVMRGGDKQWKQVIIGVRVLVIIAVVAIVGLVVILVLRPKQQKCACSHHHTPRTSWNVYYLLPLLLPITTIMVMRFLKLWPGMHNKVCSLPLLQHVSLVRIKVLKFVT